MSNKKSTIQKKRAFRVRKKLLSATTRPRLSIHRSNRHLYAQLIDCEGKTLLGLSSRDIKGENKKEIATLFGTAFGQKMQELNLGVIVVFDRGPNAYHGRVEAFAEAVRGKGIQF